MRFIATDEPLPVGSLEWPNTEDVLAHGESVHALPAIALHFPKWTDGRAYSQAVLLRLRLRYGGELVAIGEVLADMMPLLRRCGFTAARLRPDQKIEHAQRALGWFDGTVHGLPTRQPLHYQPAPGDKPVAQA